MQGRAILITFLGENKVVVNVGYGIFRKLFFFFLIFKVGGKDNATKTLLLNFINHTKHN